MVNSVATGESLHEIEGAGVFARLVFRRIETQPDESDAIDAGDGYAGDGGGEAIEENTNQWEAILLVFDLKHRLLDGFVFFKAFGHGGDPPGYVIASKHKILYFEAAAQPLYFSCTM